MSMVMSSDCSAKLSCSLGHVNFDWLLVLDPKQRFNDSLAVSDLRRTAGLERRITLNVMNE